MSVTVSGGMTWWWVGLDDAVGKVKTKPEDIMMANMSEWMHFKTVLIVRDFTLPSKLERNKKHGGFVCVRKQSQNVFILKTDLFAHLILMYISSVCSQSTKWTSEKNGLSKPIALCCNAMETPAREDAKSTKIWGQRNVELVGVVWEAAWMMGWCHC